MTIQARHVILLKQAGWLLLIIVLATAMMFSALFWTLNQELEISSKPPSVVFRLLFREPLPPGLTRLRYAGNTYPGDIYLRFQAKSPAAFIAQLKSAKAVSIRQGPEYSLQRHSANPDARLIGWNQVLTITRPISYEFSNSDDGSEWFGWIHVDSASNTVYVHGVLQ